MLTACSLPAFFCIVLQPDPRSANDTCGVLLVLPVRNPYDWAQALHRVCYCCGGMQYLTFEQFVKAPYQPQNAHDSHGEHCQTGAQGGGSAMVIGNA